MAEGINLGGINIKFGADVGNLKKGTDDAAIALNEFKNKMSGIVMEGAIKGDPFSSINKYIRTARGQLDSYFSKFETYLEDNNITVEASFGKTTDAMRNNVIKVMKYFDQAGKDADKFLNKLKTDMISLSQPKAFGVESQKSDELFDFKKVNTDEYFTKLKDTYSGYGKEVATMVNNVETAIRNQTTLSNKAIRILLGRINAELEKVKDTVAKTKFEQLDPKKTMDFLKESYAEQAKLEKQASTEVRQDKSFGPKMLERETQKLINAEAELMSQKKVGINVDKELLTLYAKRKKLGLEITAQQEKEIVAIRNRNLAAARAEAKDPRISDDIRAKKVNDVIVAERKLLAQKQRGENVDKALLAVYDRRKQLGLEIYKYQEKEIAAINKRSQAEAAAKAADPSAAYKRRAEAVAQTLNKEQELLQQKKLGVNVDRELVSIYQTLNKLGESLSAEQTEILQKTKERIMAEQRALASDPTRAQEIRAQKVNDIVVAEKELLAQKKLGENVDKELLSIYERRKKLGLDITAQQEKETAAIKARILLEARTAAGDMGVAKDIRAQKVNDIIVAERKLIAQKKLGENVDKELLAIYEKRKKLGLDIYKYQEREIAAIERKAQAEAAALAADPVIAYRKREEAVTRTRNREVELLEQKKLGVNVDRELLSIYRELERLGEKLTQDQKAMTAAIAARVRMEREAAAADPANQRQAYLDAVSNLVVREQELLGLRSHGADVIRELVSLYGQMTKLGMDLTTTQREIIELSERETFEKKEQERAARAQLAWEKQLDATRKRQEAGKEDIDVKGQLASNAVKYAEIERGQRLEELVQEEKILAAKIKQDEIDKKKNKQRAIQKRIQEEINEVAKEEAATQRRVLKIQEQRRAVALELKNLGKDKPEIDYKSGQEMLEQQALEREQAELAKAKTAYQKSSVAIQRKQSEEAAKYRIIIEQLNAEIRNNYNVEENRTKMYRTLERLQKTGINLTKQETIELKKLTKSYADNAKAKKQDSLFSMEFFGSRFTWFLRLRTYWAMYQALTEGARDLVTAHTQLSRALRTARSEFMSTEVVAKNYHRAMRDVVRIHGVGWEEAGEVLYQLGSAGLSAEESLAALNSTMSLIVGTEGDARETTKAIAGIYNNYAETLNHVGGEMEKFQYINDLVAKAWSEHQVEISELTDGYKQSVAMTKAAGLSLKDLTAVLAVANDHMIKGGRAGRALQNVFMRISRTPFEFAQSFRLTSDEFDPTKPLEFMRLMDTLALKMREGNLSVYELSRNFERLGLRGAPVFTILLQNWHKVHKAVNDFNDVSNETYRLEETRLDNLEGVWQRFVGGLRSWIQNLTPVANKLKSALRGITEILERFAAMSSVEELASTKDQIGQEKDVGALGVLKERLIRGKLTLMQDEQFNKDKERVLKDRDELLNKFYEKGLLSQKNFVELTVEEQEYLNKQLEAQYDRERLVREQQASSSFMPPQSQQEAYEKSFKYKPKEKEIQDTTKDVQKLPALGSIIKLAELDLINQALVDVTKRIRNLQLEANAFSLTTLVDEMNKLDKPDLDTYLTGPNKQELIRFLVKEDFGIVDALMQEPLKNFEQQVKAFDWGTIDKELSENMGAIFDFKGKFDESSAKKMLLNRENILALDTEILDQRKLITNEVGRLARMTKQSEGFESEEKAKTILDNLVKRYKELQEERKRRLDEIVGLTEKERRALIKNYVIEHDQTVEQIRKEKMLRKSLYLFGLSAKEAELARESVKRELEYSIHQNQIEETKAILRAQGNDEARLTAIETRKSADAASIEASEAENLVILRQRLVTIEKSYNTTRSKDARVYKETAALNKANNATKLEELKLQYKYIRSQKHSYESQLLSLKAEYNSTNNAQEQVEIQAKIEELQKSLNELKIEDMEVTYEIRKQASIMLDIYTRLRAITEDITTWWHDLAWQFTEGMADGLSNMWFEFISGSQAARQEIVNIKGEIKGLKDERDTLTEKGLFSYEDAKRLQEINDKIKQLKSDIEDLKDPLKQAEKQFKDFFKSLIDEINKAIIKMIAYWAIQKLVGLAVGSGDAEFDPSYAQTPIESEKFKATGGVINRIDSFRKFSSGGVTGNPAVAILGDNASGKELVIPAENIDKNRVSGYTRDSDEKQPITIVNALTKEDIAIAMAGKEGERVVINHIGRDFDSGGPVSRRLRV